MKRFLLGISLVFIAIAGNTYIVHALNVIDLYHIFSNDQHVPNRSFALKPGWPEYISVSKDNPTMGEIVEVAYKFRNDKKWVRNGEVRIYKLNRCGLLADVPGQPLWDFRGSILLDTIDMDVIAPYEIVSGRIKIPITEENGFIPYPLNEEAGRTRRYDDGPCNRVVLEFFSPNNDFRLAWTQFIVNFNFWVYDATTNRSDYQIEAVKLNDQDVDGNNPLIINPEEKTKLTVKIRNIGNEIGTGASVCLQPFNIIQFPDAWNNVCGWLPPIEPGTTKELDILFSAKTKIMTQPVITNEYPESINTQFNRGEMNTAILRMHPLTTDVAEISENNISSFSFILQ